MIDDVSVIQALAQKLKLKFEGLQLATKEAIDSEIERFKVEAQAKVDDYLATTTQGLTSTTMEALASSITTLETKVGQSATELLSELRTTLDQRALDEVKIIQAGNQVALSTLRGEAKDLINAALLSLIEDAQNKIDEAVKEAYQLKEGKRGPAGVKVVKGKDGKDGLDGQDGVGIKKITQSAQDKVTFLLTDGTSYTLTLPRGRSGGVITQVASQLSTDKNPQYTYNLDNTLASILYDNGATKTFTYSGGLLSIFDYTSSGVTIRKTFNWVDGMLMSSTEATV